MNPEVSQVVQAIMLGAGGFSGWRFMQYVIGRWFDRQAAQSGDDASIRREQAKRIDDLERKVEELQSKLIAAESRATRAEVKVEVLEKRLVQMEQWCGQHERREMP